MFSKFPTPEHSYAKCIVISKLHFHFTAHFVSFTNTSMEPKTWIFLYEMLPFIYCLQSYPLPWTKTQPPIIQIPKFSVTDTTWYYWIYKFVMQSVKIPITKIMWHWSHDTEVTWLSTNPSKGHFGPQTNQSVNQSAVPQRLQKSNQDNHCTMISCTAITFCALNMPRRLFKKSTCTVHPPALLICHNLWHIKLPFITRSPGVLQSSQINSHSQYYKNHVDERALES